ncbi:MAG: alpha/beta hydrolase family protein [Planctomycetales bacterium]
MALLFVLLLVPLRFAPIDCQRVFAADDPPGKKVPLAAVNGRVAEAAPLDDQDHLPCTRLLEAARPLDELMLEGLQRFCLRELDTARLARAAQWERDAADPSAREKCLDGLRRRWQSLIGADDRRLTRQVDPPLSFELVSTLDQSSVVARNDGVTVHVVRWPVLEGVVAEGLLLVPRTPRAGVVAVPDAAWTPEMFCGVSPGLPDSVQFARRLAEGGCLVAIPMLISRSDEFSGHPRVGFTNQSHREFLYRQAFEAGRHVIGYEVQKILAAVDLLVQRGARLAGTGGAESFPVGVAGVGEGGMLALYAATLDERIVSCWVSGYFQEREQIWREPIDRNVWGRLTDFGDAELAGMIAPRRLVIEACRAVEVAGPSAPREGRRAAAAPGAIATCPLPSVRQEFERAAGLYRRAGQESQLILAISSEQGDGPPGSAAALRAFAEGLRITDSLDSKPQAWEPGSLLDETRPSVAEWSRAREKRQFDEIQAHVQSLLRRSHQARDAQWLSQSASLVEWEGVRPGLRDRVHEELIGRLPHARVPPRPRSRRILDTPDFVGYEIVLDVVEEVIASGILLLPKNLTPGERRPVVVCQHGLEGTPLDTITRDPPAFAYYKAFSEQLVRRGFIVYAPQNPYRGGDRFRVLQRMSHPLQRSLFTYIIAQHAQTLDWLATLPQVDSSRIAFYGLSYGGKTAMRVPPFVERYALSICSGDFTDWPRTIASNDEPVSYLFTSEYEIPEWNLAHVASYAELAMLISPRPFLVEAGHRDSGQPSDWVAGEFGKVRRHYDQLGISDRAVLEFFDGPHTIHGNESFRFLHRWLQWPETK